jgi:tetratricopeptide (TPR) repeat protein
MARRSYGDEVKARVKRFFEALLAYLNHEYEDGETFGIKFDWQGETEVVVNGKRRKLEELTLHDRYEGKLTAAQVREAIKYLEEFLEILKDNRATTQGSEEWHFTLKLWHRDKAENLRQFDFEWESRRPAKSKAVAENKKDAGIPPDPEPRVILNNLGCKGIDNPEAFIGRKQELAEIHQLLQQTGKVVISAISGMGGVGKTELALQYAHRHLSDYGGVVWFSAKAGDLGVQLVEFAFAYFPGFVMPEVLKTQLRQVEYCLQSWPTVGPVLLIFDDVDRYAAVKDYLEILQTRFKVLITTRLRLGGTVQTLTLDVLPPLEALQLLARWVPGERICCELETKQDRPSQLCEWLGYLPLGIELVGRYLARKPDVSLAQMQQRLSEKRLEQVAMKKPDDDMTAKLGVKAAFELTWQELSGEAQQLAGLLGLFAPAAIPWPLVEQCLPEKDAEELEELRDESLLNWHLLDRVEAKTYKLHPLIREFCQMKLTEMDQTEELQGVEERLKQAFAAVMVGVAKEIPQTITRDVIASVSPMIPHLEVVVKDLFAGFDYGLEGYDLIWPFNGLGRFYQGQSLYETAEVWYRQCVTVAKQRFGDADPEVATSLNNLAELYRNQGKYNQAEPLYLEAVQIIRRSLPADHPQLATHLNNLALLYKSQGKYNEAEPLYLEALEIDRRSLPADHPDLAISLNNLANLYESQGKYNEAEPLYLEALEIIRRSLPADHPDLAISLNNLANLYESQGKYNEAEPLYLEALEIDRRSLPKDHPSLAISLNNLANLYESQGKYNEAEPLYLEALEIDRRSLPADHPSLAISLNNLANLYESQGKYNEAEPLYLEALEIDRRSLPADHPSLATHLNNLANLYESQGKYNEAEPLYLEALEIDRRSLPADHPDLATHLNNLAGLYENQGKYNEAEPLYLEALEIFENKLGADHSYTVNTRLALQLTRLQNLDTSFDEADDSNDEFGSLLRELFNALNPDNTDSE